MKPTSFLSCVLLSVIACAVASNIRSGNETDTTQFPPTTEDWNATAPYFPDSTCKSMIPFDENMTFVMIDAQSSDIKFLFSISQDNTTMIQPGDNITVSVEVTGPVRFFEEFLIQAHTDNNTSSQNAAAPIQLGTFSTTQNDTLVACGGKAVNSFTDKFYRQTEFQWTAPDVTDTTIAYFVGTFTLNETTAIANVRSADFIIVHVPVPANSDDGTTVVPKQGGQSNNGTTEVSNQGGQSNGGTTDSGQNGRGTGTKPFAAKFLLLVTMTTSVFILSH